MNRIAVIGGGDNCEHEVSLASAAAVRAALEGTHELVCFTIARDGSWLDDLGPIPFGDVVRQLQSCDVVLPIVHGPRGEDGTLAALCELIGVPYVGCGVTAGAIAMDKVATKAVAQSVGVPVAAGQVVSRAEDATWPGRCVVKPVAAGSSRGVTLVERSEDFVDAVTNALALDHRALVEEVVVGREVDLAVIDLPDGRRLVGPPLEIVATGIFDYSEKYDGNADFRLPATLTPDEHDALRESALAVYDAIGCRGLARIDFFLTAAGPVLNEVNTMPGLTPMSQLPKMMAAAGLDYAALLDTLIQTARRQVLARA